MVRNTVFFMLLVFFFTGCGSDSGSGGGSKDGGGTDSGSKAALLTAVADFGVVTEIEAIDLNNDGYMDLVLARTKENPFYQQGYLQALINNGDKTFTDATNRYFPGLGTNWKWIEKIYFADLNGDSKPDIVGHTDQADILLPPLIRQADGSFAPVAQSDLTAAGALLPIDYDNDGDTDIINHVIDSWAVPADQVLKWSLYENDLVPSGTMTFTDPSKTFVNLKKGWDYTAFPMAPVIADINLDGLPDLFYGGPKWKNGGFIDETVELTVFLNDGNGDFTENTESVFAGAVPKITHLRDTATADFNGDGLTDILIANTGFDWAPYPGQGNLILFQQADGKLRVETGTSETLNYKGFTHSSDVGDIDMDGDIDIVFTDMLGDDVSVSDRIRILVNDGSGNFTRRTRSIEKQYMTENNWTSTKLVDLNNDGFPELVLGGSDSNSSSLVFWNNSGAF